MNILVAHFNDISDYPPTQNLINNLIKLGYNIDLISFDRNDYIKNNKLKLNFHKLGGCYSDIKENKLKRFASYIKWHHIYIQKLKEIACNTDILWLTSSQSLIVNRKFYRRYKKVIIQFMELQFSWNPIPGLLLYKLPIKNYADLADCIVMPEINRAHILKNVASLKKMPKILPNKNELKYDNKIENKIVTNKIKKLNNKKIIIYQGYIHKERSLDGLAKWVGQNSDYVLCIVGADNKERKEFCKKYPFVEYLGYVPSPNHLILDSYAHIGVLSYNPMVHKRIDEVLNVSYCAPNKVFEYTKFGLPFIGNEIPGLTYLEDKYKIGCTCNFNDLDSITKAITKIESNYKTWKDRCKEFYNSVNSLKITKNIIESIK